MLQQYHQCMLGKMGYSILIPFLPPDVCSINTVIPLQSTWRLTTPVCRWQIVDRPSPTSSPSSHVSTWTGYNRISLHFYRWCSPAKMTERVHPNSRCVVLFCCCFSFLFLQLPHCDLHLALQPSHPHKHRELYSDSYYSAPTQTMHCILQLRWPQLTLSVNYWLVPPHWSGTPHGGARRHMPSARRLPLQLSGRQVECRKQS